ncbi:MAG TPA: hypothetical protein VGN84_12430 [Solirubrobacterales bacterium]|nr:hypothetical protein [Solirubrobacterales bacterium]
MKRLLGIGVVIACILFAGGANAALVKVGNLVLTADGGFTPRTLPQQAFAPIDFTGHADLRSADGSVPPALQQVVLDFDRDGRLSTGGLPICQPSLLEEATPAEARGRCPNAIVGTGHVSAMIVREAGAPILASSQITLFNGPRQEGHPTVVLHARTTVPATQNFVLTIPIEKRPGQYRYRATVDVPPIAAGRGSLIHLDVKIGKRYRYRGSERSYTTARCGDGVFRTRGRFTFADSTIVEGSVEKPCTVRR